MTQLGERRDGAFARFIDDAWRITIIVVLALVLRLINLGGRALWYDEAFAVLYAEQPLGTMLYGTVTQVDGAAADVHPLFFYSVLHLWMRVFGQSPVAVRSLSVLLGTATVVLAYLLGRRLFDRRVGLAAALLVGIAPFHVYYSQEARMYALLGFAALGMSYFFVRAWVDGGWGNWLAFALFGALTLYAHNLGGMFLVGLDLWVLWAWFRPGGARWRNFRPLLLSQLLVIGLFAPWLVVVPSQFGKIQQAYWVEQPGLLKLIQTLLIFHFAYDNQSLPRWLLPLALFFSILIPVMLAFELIRRRRTSRYQPPRPASPRKGPAGSALLLLLTITPILLTFLASQVQPVYIVRALLPSALVYYVLLAGILIGGSVPVPVKSVLLLPAGLIVAASLINHYTYAEFPRPPFDQVAAFLSGHYQPGDVIVHSNKLTFFPTHYYDRSLPQEFIADEPGSPSDTLAYPTQQALGLLATSDIETATSGRERVWLVVFRREIDEYRAAGYSDHPHRAWLEGNYTLVSVTSFGDLDIYEYQSGPSPTALLPMEANP